MGVRGVGDAGGSGPDPGADTAGRMTEPALGTTGLGVNNNTWKACGPPRGDESVVPGRPLASGTLAPLSFQR